MTNPVSPASPRSSRPRTSTPPSPSTATRSACPSRRRSRGKAERASPSSPSRSATLELSNPAQVRLIDEVEVGRPVERPYPLSIRVAFEVADAAAADHHARGSRGDRRRPTDGDAVALAQRAPRGARADCRSPPTRSSRPSRSARASPASAIGPLVAATARARRPTARSLALARGVGRRLASRRRVRRSWRVGVVKPTSPRGRGRSRPTRAARACIVSAGRLVVPRRSIACCPTRAGSRRRARDRRTLRSPRTGRGPVTGRRP